jgi:hypothetical protein
MVQEKRIRVQGLRRKEMKAKIKSNGKIIEVEPRKVYSNKGEFLCVDYVDVNDDAISYDEDELIIIKNESKMEKEVKETKQLRKDIDETIQRVKNLEQCRETSLAVTKLQEAVMWLGMNLKRIGEQNPYPESYNPESTRIEPTADGLKL